MKFCHQYGKYCILSALAAFRDTTQPFATTSIFFLPKSDWPGHSVMYFFVFECVTMVSEKLGNSEKKMIINRFVIHFFSFLVDAPYTYANVKHNNFGQK